MNDQVQNFTSSFFGYETTYLTLAYAKMIRRGRNVAAFSAAYRRKAIGHRASRKANGRKTSWLNDERSSQSLAVPMSNFHMTSTLNSAAKLVAASGGSASSR